MTFNGTYINEQWAATLTLEAFIKHEAHLAWSKDLYKEAHALCKAAVRSPKAAPVSDSSGRPE
jgi:hypothetical protein